MDTKSISLLKSDDISHFPNHEIRNFLQAEDGKKLGNEHWYLWTVIKQYTFIIHSLMFACMCLCIYMYVYTF